MADPKSLWKEINQYNNLTFNIRYADDTTILSTAFEKLPFSTEEIQAACKKWGMKINFSKWKVITSSEKCIVQESEKLETAEEFCFLGSVVSSTQRYVKRRIALASVALGRV